jgi:hypothetical protein
LHRARWGGGVLTRDGRRWWGRENDLAWWSTGGRRGHRRVLQLEEGTEEVRRGPKGADDGGAVELTEGGGDNGAVA